MTSSKVFNSGSRILSTINDFTTKIGNQVPEWVAKPVTDALGNIIKKGQDLVSPSPPLVEQSYIERSLLDNGSLRSPNEVIRHNITTRYVVTTYRCNGICRNCYARHLKELYPDMTEDGFLRCLDWLEANGISMIRFIGGEPTLHPLLPRFFEIARNRGFAISLYTNATFSESVAESLWLVDGIVWVNYSLLEVAPESMSRLIHRNLRYLADNMRRPILSYTVDLQTSLGDQLLNVAEDLGKVRVYLMPAWSPSNGDLEIDNARGVTLKILNILEKAISRGIPAVIMSPLITCALDKSMKKRFNELDPYIYYTRCAMGFGGDYTTRSLINPDLSAVPCANCFFPSPPITQFKNNRELSSFFKNHIISLFHNPPMKKCKSCKHHKAFLDTIDCDDPEKFLSLETCQSSCLQYHWQKGLAEGRLPLDLVRYTP